MTTGPSIGAAPIVAPRIDSTEWYSGSTPALEIHAIAEGIRNRDWAEVGIGSLGVVSEGVGLIADPIATLSSWGVGWLIEHIEPLSRALDWLTGDPDQVAAYGQTWRNIAVVTGSVADLYDQAIRRDLPSWDGDAADQYQAWASERAEVTRALRAAADGVAGLSDAVETVVNAVRSAVRALISFVVGKAISWTIEAVASGGLAMPIVIEQAVLAVGQATVRVTRIVKDLFTSLRRLHEMLKQYKLMIVGLRVAVGVRAGDYAFKPYGG